MARDLDIPQWKGQRPWFEIWFAVVLDASGRRALWIRQTTFVPRQGDGRATIWGAWFDADATPQTVAAKRFVPIDQARAGEADQLIQIDDNWLGRGGASGSVTGLGWDVTWSGGRDHDNVPAWLPTPTHARSIVHDAEASGTITIGDRTLAIGGRAVAMHLWGKRRVPKLHWIWSPWTGDRSLEIQSVSLRDRLGLSFSTLRLDDNVHGRPATAAHASCLVTATVAGPRRLVRARAWAEPEQMVGYAYRDTDDRDLMIAQSDIGAAYYETYSRAIPGAPWHPIDERRVSGGVAVEIHQRTPLPEVRYIGWDEVERPAAPAVVTHAGRDCVDWPDVTAIVALGLTYSDHVRESGQGLDPTTPPITFTKHTRTFVPGDRAVRVPDTAELLAALEAIEPGLSATLRDRLPLIPAVMDYEGEVALVALGAIDDEQLAAGIAQPFGVAAIDDLTARFCQVLGDTMDRNLDYWACAKSFPGFLPTAARVWAPPGGIATMPELTIATRVNGEQRQHASTKLILYPLHAMVRAARVHLGRPLVRGDMILTGTPAGVGVRMSPLKRRVAALIKDRFRKAELLVSSFAASTELLRPGDVIEVDAGPAGRVRTRLVV